MSITKHVSRRMRKLREKTRKRRLLIALFLAIILTLVSTAVSLVIYKVGGFYRYDLSRPGYEKERTEVSASQTTVTYDTTSVLTKDNVQTAINELDGRIKAVDGYDTFKNDSLSDASLQITSN